jgi:hypothetical protein
MPNPRDTTFRGEAVLPGAASPAAGGTVDAW